MSGVEQSTQELALLATFKAELARFGRNFNDLKKLENSTRISSPAVVLCKLCTNLEELQEYGYELCLPVHVHGIRKVEYIDHFFVAKRPIRSHVSPWKQERHVCDILSIHISLPCSAAAYETLLPIMDAALKYFIRFGEESNYANLVKMDQAALFLLFQSLMVLCIKDNIPVSIELPKIPGSCPYQSRLSRFPN